MHCRHPNGKNSRLSGRHQHHGLQRDRYGSSSSRCTTTCPGSESTAYHFAGYDYDAAKEDMRKRLNLQPENFFLTRAMTKEKFKDIREWGERYTFFGTPIYLDFLAGKRELTCSAWAIPTRNVRGWKAPCYLMTDGHYSSYRELLEEDRLGEIWRGGWRRARQALRELHGPLWIRAQRHARSLCQRGDTWQNITFNFGPKPAPRSEGASVNPFNGVTAGNGHKTGRPKKQQPAAA